MSVSYDAYKVFYVTAKNRSITAAAKELFVTQPTITHCIRKMEEELGCVLFLRGKKGVELTPEGNVLYHHISIACEQIEEAETAIEQMKEVEKGDIAIGASETTLHHFLFPYLREFKTQFPGIRLKIHNSSTPGMMEAIQNNLLDCGVLVFPMDYKKKGIQIETLTTFLDIAIVGKAYKDLAASPISLKELIRYPLISMEQGTITNQILRQTFAQYQLELQPDIELATTDLIVPTVINNLGIGFVPEAFAKEALERKEIYQLELLEPLALRRICLVYKEGKPASHAARAFMKCLRECK